MKLTALLVALVASLVVVPAISGSASDRAAAANAGRDDAARETREAIDAYRRALKDEIDQIGKKLNALEDRAKASLRDARPETKRLLEKLRHEHAVAKQKLDELSHEASRLWDGVRARMNRLVDDLNRHHEAAEERI